MKEAEKHLGVIGSSDFLVQCAHAVDAGLKPRVVHRNLAVSQVCA
jgi:hypothetical protein